MIKLISYVKRNRFTSSSLTLNFSKFDKIIVNTLRRISMDLIPTYAFSPETTTITENTAIAFNNDYLRLRFSQLPIFNINLDLFELPEKYWLNVNYSDKNRDKHPLEQDIDLYLNHINMTGDIISITTNDIITQVNNIETKMYDKDFPILLVKLKPNEKIHCHLHAVLGVGDRNSIWSASSNSYYEIQDDDSIYFTIESNGMLDEFDILIKCCQFVNKRIMDIESKIKEINDTTTILELEGEDHTFGNLINYFLQNNKNVLFSGVYKPDLLQKSISIKIKSSSNLDEIIKATFNEIKKTFDTIKSLIEKIGKKH